MGLIDESYFRSESLNLTSTRESFDVHCAPNWTMYLFSILTHNNFVGKCTVVQLDNEFQAKYPRHPGGGCLEKKVILTWIGQTRCYYFHMTNTMPPLYPIIVSKKKDGNRKAVYKYCHLKKHEFCGVSTSLMPWDRCDLNFNATKITWHSANLQ